jgi:hypothetical protein
MNDTIILVTSNGMGGMGDIIEAQFKTATVITG